MGGGKEQLFINEIMAFIAFLRLIFDSNLATYHNKKRRLIIGYFPVHSTSFAKIHVLAGNVEKSPPNKSSTIYVTTASVLICVPHL